MAREPLTSKGAPSARSHNADNFKNDEVEQGNFNSYRILRMNKMPKVEVYIREQPQHATGMGEPGLPPLAPAVTAAIFKASESAS